MIKTTYRINLIRDRVTPPALRRALYWSTMLYILACGAALAAIFYAATSRFVLALDAQRQTRSIEEQFRIDYPQERLILTYAQKLGRQLDGRQALLERVNQVLATRAGLAHVLLGLVQPLPGGTYLVDFTYDPKARKVAFTVVTPADVSSSTVTAGNLLTLWQQEAGLVGRLTDVGSEASQRQMYNGRAVLAHRFAARIGI